jgi:hypothetical protein
MTVEEGYGSRGSVLSVMMMMMKLMLACFVLNIISK